MRAIRCANAHPNTDRNCDSGCNSHADGDPYPNAYAYPLHGQMCTDAQASPDPSASPVVKRLAKTVTAVFLLP